MPKVTLTENGNAKMENGKLVMESDTGEVFQWDPVAGYAELREVRAVAGTQRVKLKDIEKRLESFGDLNPDEAKQALLTVKTVGEEHKAAIDKIKTEMSGVYEKKLGESDDRIKGLENQLFKLTVTDKFHTSPTAKTLIYTPVDAAKIFDQFELDETGRLLGKINGEIIYSRERPGEPADFEESLKAMIEARPDKEQIIKSSGMQGTGSRPGGGGSAINRELSSYDRIKKGLDERRKS